MEDNVKWFNLRVIGVSERKEIKWGRKKILEKLEEKFLNLMKI